MKKLNPKLHELYELLNLYPSPHNGQPIRIKQLNDKDFELYFETRRGLQAAEVSFLFSFVTMGLFATYLEQCVEALGHNVKVEPRLPKVSELHADGQLRFAVFSLEFDAREPNKEMLQSIHFRQTSRKKYTSGVSDEVAASAIALAKEHHMKMVQMDEHGTHQAIWLNQRAVFDDMFDDAVRLELNHWLRYSKAEKEAKMDGLSYDCMELSGHLLRFIVKHYKILRAPVISSLLKQYYLRTMKDKSDAFYMLTPFATEREAYDVGVVIMKTWQLFSAHGYYLHPFGTIMSNDAAHHDFLKLISLNKEDDTKNFLSFIFRAGKSPQPNHSLRLPVEKHLIME